MLDMDIDMDRDMDMDMDGVNEKNAALTNFRKKKENEHELQSINYPNHPNHPNQDMLEKLLKMQQFENQGALSKIVNEFINGPNSSEIIDPRDAITMVSVGGMFVMACAMLLMMAIQGMFIKKIITFI